MKRNIIVGIACICCTLTGCGEYPGPHTFAPDIQNGELITFIATEPPLTAFSPNRMWMPVL